MAQGAPVVTSAGTATEEVAGDAALLVDPVDTDAIAGAIDERRAIPSSPSRSATAGRARAAVYTWERSGRTRWPAVYAEAAGAP